VAAAANPMSLHPLLLKALVMFKALHSLPR